MRRWKSVGIIIGVDCGVSGTCLECVLLHVEDKL